MLSQWLDEIDAARVHETLDEVKGRLDRREDPLAKYGIRAKELAKMLYSLIQSQTQDQPTTHIAWTPQFEPFIKEFRYFESDHLITGSHAIGPDGEFTEGFWLANSGFIVLLALLYDDPKKIARLVEIIDNAKDRLKGVELRESVELPLTVIDAFFQRYKQRGQGLKSEERGSSLYIPKP